jgi:hypothetical protein
MHVFILNFLLFFFAIFLFFNVRSVCFFPLVGIFSRRLLRFFCCPPSDSGFFRLYFLLVYSAISCWFNLNRVRMCVFLCLPLAHNTYQAFVPVLSTLTLYGNTGEAVGLHMFESGVSTQCSEGAGEGNLDTSIKCCFLLKCRKFLFC